MPIKRQWLIWFHGRTVQKEEAFELLKVKQKRRWQKKRRVGRTMIVKIIMGTLHNYDLISFMLMVAFYSPYFPFHSTFPSISALTEIWLSIYIVIYLIDGDCNTSSRLSFHLFSLFVFLLRPPYDKIYKHQFIFNGFTFCVSGGSRDFQGVRGRKKSCAGWCFDGRTFMYL